MVRWHMLVYSEQCRSAQCGMAAILWRKSTLRTLKNIFCYSKPTYGHRNWVNGLHRFLTALIRFFHNLVGFKFFCTSVSWLLILVIGGFLVWYVTDLIGIKVGFAVMVAAWLSSDKADIAVMQLAALSDEMRFAIGCFWNRSLSSTAQLLVCDGSIMPWISHVWVKKVIDGNIMVYTWWRRQFFDPCCGHVSDSWTFIDGRFLNELWGL